MDRARDPKTYASRLETDYYRRPRGLRRAKWLWSVVALAIAGVAAAAMVARPGWHFAFQAGPVSSAHAVFGGDCAACHDTRFAPLARLIPGIKSASVSDQKCLDCHSAGRHDPHQLAFTRSGGHEAAGCVSCHMEHRGEVLARLSDSTCVACHADLKTTDGIARYGNGIRHFTDGHPEFAAWRGKPLSDPAGGKFFFNHERHLQLATEAGEIAPDRRPVLAAELAKLKSLDCAYCHQTDPDGKRMQPVRYDLHCAACHPLNVVAQPAGAIPDGLATEFSKEPLPHPNAGQGASLIRSTLVARYLAAGPPKPAGEVATVEPAVLRQAEEQAGLDRERLALDRARLTESQLFGRAGVGCALCHLEVSRSDGLPTYAPAYQQLGRWRDEIARWPDPAKYKSSSYADAANRWFPLSTFDHRAHRSQSCADCHAAATSSKTGDVLMPALASCAKCHHAGANAARSDCLTCHTYHDRSQEGLSPKATPAALSDKLK